MHIYSGHNVQHIPINQTRGISGPGRQLHGISGTQYIYPGRFLCNQFSGPFFFSLLKVAFVGSILRGPNFIRLDFGLSVVYVRFRR